MSGATGRPVRVLPMPPDDTVLQHLPALAAALAGDGPVLLPVPADDDTTAARLARDLAADAPVPPAEDDPADPVVLMIATSGSTGTAKGVLLPAGALCASAAATAQHLGGPADDRADDPADGASAGPASDPAAVHWLLPLPSWHIGGLQVLLRSLAAGTEPLVLAPPFRAASFTAAVHRMPSGPRRTSLVPTQLRRVLDDAEATAALATFDAVLVGGAATPPDLQDAARAVGIRIVTTYGMSETAGGSVYDGIPLPGAEVGLLGPDDAAGDGSAGPTSGGIIAIRGPMVARGYRGRPGDPAFPADPGAGALRTFVTTDLGRWDGDRLQVLGRRDDVIVTGGENVVPLRVEAALRRVPGVRDVVVTGVPDPEWGQAVVAVVVPDLGAGTATLPAAVRAAGRALDRPSEPRRVVLVAQIPTLGPGKPDRAAVRRLAAGDSPPPW
ncbi:AMP-binding protein [Nakamurella leprariae]|uniref:AMP-binding protein n=1 Tax=Nakamurella leprariae TaxID=2803911 RepID=A0A939BV82_9ACTN|nr:AMP-binding protein [Nakamurella leprariae]MBM9466268.1 AMP-binding protein [Nakamurella leprariae]